MELLNECRDFGPGGIWWEMFELILRSLTFVSYQICLRHCWVMMLKIQLLHHNYISKYIQIENSYLHFNNILQFYCFCCILVSRRASKILKTKPKLLNLYMRLFFSIKRQLWEARDCSIYSAFNLLGKIWKKSNLWFFFPCGSVCICDMGSSECWAGVCLVVLVECVWAQTRLRSDSSGVCVCVCVCVCELAFSPGLSVRARVWRHNTVHKKPLVLKTPEEHWRRIKMNQWLTHTFKAGLTLYTKS